MMICYLPLSNRFHVHNIGEGQVYYSLTGNCSAKNQQLRFLISFLTANDNEFSSIRTWLNPVPDDMRSSQHHGVVSGIINDGNGKAVVQVDVTDRDLHGLGIGTIVESHHVLVGHSNCAIIVWRDRLGAVSVTVGVETGQ
jgi:hypothetical protein